MKFTAHTNNAQPSGFALIMVMIFLAVSLTVFASMMYWASSNSKITLRNNAFNQAEAAAESGTENSLAYMIRDFAFEALNPASSYTNLLPSQTGWPIQYQFGMPQISIGSTNWSTNLPSEFAGLSGLVQNATNTLTATATTGPITVPATVQQIIAFASIPVFQYAIFYNMDLEICPGAAMTINGHVHSNNNIYATGDSSSAPLDFSSYVNASGTYTNSRSPNDPQSWSPGNINFTITQNNPLSHVDSLAMPIGTNNNPLAVEGILQLPPSNLTAPLAAAYSPTGTVYLYNSADLIVTNTAGGTNFTVLYDNPNNSPQLQPVLPDQQVVTNYHVGVATYYVTNYFYSYLTNVSFYDYRESDTVKAIQLNVSNLVAWLTNNVTVGGTNRGGLQYNNLNSTGSSSKGHGINSVYIYNSVPMSSSTLPGVRVVNGAQLPPSGLTVATAMPLYVEGNYNIQTNSGGTQALTLGSTTNGVTVPASLMGDSLTVLSGAWNDSDTSGTALTSRNPTATTINAATLEGIVPSFTASGTKYYSGGVENFLRMLENWSGVNLNYNGSIVVMFPSQYATNVWVGPGTYYNPPNRNWGFDVNYSKGPQYLPPLTPQAKYVIRYSWAAW
jgi:hypothetical protein